jgi:uncharacterized membrane protein
MSKLVVVTFPDEAKAYEGLHQLRALHAEGSVSLYAAALVRREPDGALTVKEREDQGPLGTALGLLLGTIVGVLGGPVGMAAGALAGGILGTTRDLVQLGVSDEFLDETARDLTAGKYAVIAEVAEEWTAPIDVRMEALGGKVTREWREDFVDDLLERPAAARHKELENWKAQRAAVKAERMEERLQASLTREQEKARAQAYRARKKLEARKAEFDAKVAALEAQAAKATPEAKARIQQRAAEIRKEYSEAEKKLTNAYQLSQEVLTPATMR